MCSLFVLSTVYLHLTKPLNGFRFHFLILCSTFTCPCRCLWRPGSTTWPTPSCWISSRSSRDWVKWTTSTLSWNSTTTGLLVSRGVSWSGSFRLGGQGGLHGQWGPTLLPMLRTSLSRSESLYPEFHSQDIVYWLRESVRENERASERRQLEEAWYLVIIRDGSVGLLNYKKGKQETWELHWSFLTLECVLFLDFFL